MGYSRALHLVPPPNGPGRKLGDPGDLCLAPGSVHGVPVALGTPDLLPVPLPGLSLCGFIAGVFFKLVLFAFFFPKPCLCPSVGLNKQSLNTPVCVGAVAADGVCGPHCLIVSPAL